MSDDTDPSILADLNARLGGYDREMGLRFVSVSEAHVAAEMPVTQRHLQPYGLVHGGVYAAMVETLCSVGAALSAARHGRTAVGLENHTSFLHATREGTLHGRAEPLTHGRRTQVWETTIRDDAGRVLATGRVRMLCLEAGAAIAGETVQDKTER